MLKMWFMRVGPNAKTVVFIRGDHDTDVPRGKNRYRHTCQTRSETSEEIKCANTLTSEF